MRSDRKSRVFQVVSTVAVLVMLFGGTVSPRVVDAEPKAIFATSDYIGWGLMYRLNRTGRMAEWGKALGCNLSIEEMTYDDSLGAYSGAAAGVNMTQIDAMMAPAANQIDGTALFVVSSSYGNDAVCMRHGKKLCDLGPDDVVVGFSGSVSDVTFERLWEIEKCSGEKPKWEHIGDGDIVARSRDKTVSAAVTWKPAVTEIDGSPDYECKSYTSAAIPGEILDLAVMKTKVVEKHPQCALAVTAAWFEAVGVWGRGGAPRRKALTDLKNAFNAPSTAAIEGMLDTTRFWIRPAENATYMRSAEMAGDVKRVYEKQVQMGQVPKSLGILLADGTRVGGETVLLRFDLKFVDQVANGDVKAPPRK